MKKFSLILISLSTLASATELSPGELYARCYSHLTQELPKYNDTRLKQVVAGSLDPITACMQILDKARIVSGMIRDTQDPVAKLVIANFQRLHASWFLYPTFDRDFFNTYLSLRKATFDPQQPALFYTYALLAPGFKISSVLKANTNYEAVRTNDNPTSAASGIMAKDFFVFGNETPFLPQGELLGIKSSGNKSVTSLNNVTVLFGRHFGGGALGTSSYSMTTQPAFTQANVANMPRTFAKAVYHDFLCRDLPVIRYEDAAPYVNANSELEFRKQASCTTCHASMDRTAAFHRGLHYQVVRDIKNADGSRSRGGTFPVRYADDKPAGGVFPIKVDSDYHRRPNEGVLFFRNYLGQRISVAGTGLQGLADAILAQDDFYICVAKRYYKYLTGIDAFTGDIGDPNLPALSQEQKNHRNIVIQLGKDLRTNEDPRLVLESIMRMDHYKQSDYSTQ